MDNFLRMTRIFLSMAIFLTTIFVQSIYCFSADNATLLKLKEELALANRILDYEGLARPLGHISVRIPGTDRFLIAGSTAPGLTTVDDIVVCDMSGKVIEGKYNRTYGEVWAHIGIYKKHKDVNCVTHIHPPYVIALSITGTPILPVSLTGLGLGPDPIAIWKTVAFIHTLEYGEEVADLLGPNKAVTLKGHGAVVVGNSIVDTTERSVLMEKVARYQLMAMSAGNVIPLTEEGKRPYKEFTKMMDSRPRGGGSERFWSLYEHLLREK